MHKLTRLEIGCLAVTFLIIVITAVTLVNRTIDQKISAGDPSDLDQAPPRIEAGSLADSSSGQSSGFEEQARRIPSPRAPSAPQDASVVSPHSETAQPAATDLAGSLTNTPLTKTGSDTTSDILQELQRIATLPWTASTEQQLQAVVSKWASIDPLGALQYAGQIESRRVRSALLAGIFSTWAKTDINGAYNWMLANRESDPTAFLAGLKPVFSILAADNLDRAMQMALQIPPGGDRISALRLVVDQASRNGAAASMSAYLDTLQTPGERRNYASMLAQSWALYDPLQAIQWANSLADPAMRKSSLSSAISVWAADNPSAASAYVLTIQDSDLRSRQIAQVTQSWAKYDPVKAADWLLAQHPPSPALDPAIQSLAGTVMQSNPEGAVMWAATISDPNLRTRTIMNVSREWMRSDPAKASAYISTAPLTPNQKARLLHAR